MKNRLSLNMMRSKTTIKARDINMIHRSVRGIRDGWLEVDAMGERSGILIVGSHGDTMWRCMKLDNVERGLMSKFQYTSSLVGREKGRKKYLQLEEYGRYQE